MFYNSIIL